MLWNLRYHRCNQLCKASVYVGGWCTSEGGGICSISGGRRMEFRFCRHADDPEWPNVRRRMPDPSDEVSRWFTHRVRN